MNEGEVKNKETIEALFNAGAHFAFSKSRRHPSMAQYIFGAKNKVEIFDLEKVAELVESTKDYLEKCGVERKKVLFVGGKNEARAIVAEAATELEMPYVAGRWIGGTLTNYSEIKKRISRMSDLISKREKGELSKFTKLEQLHIDREITDLEKTFGGLKTLEGLPHVMVVVDTKHEEIAVAEAKKMNIPVVGIINSDCDTSDANHFIVGNDSSVASIKYLVDQIVTSYKKGLEKAPAPKAAPEKTAPKVGATSNK